MSVPNSQSLRDSHTLATRHSRESVSPYTMISIFHLPSIVSVISEINEEHNYFYHCLVCMHLA